MCVFVCPAALCSFGLDWTCAAAGGSPFQACYLLLNKSAAGDGTQGTDGQRASQGEGLTSTLCGNRAPWTGGGEG